jgi:hypothetical protein
VRFPDFAPSAFLRETASSNGVTQEIKWREAEMNRRIVSGFLGAVMALAIAMPALAGSRTSGEAKHEIKTTFTLPSAVMVGTQQLKPGVYDVIAKDTQVTFRKDGKTVAQANVQWKDNSTKVPATSVVLDGNQLKEVRFGGKTQSILVE